ncbi:MAG TPA: fatty acid--CoA ligase family protein, partial [Rhodocyclaceae bacterium]|nr:fatty acid--CoA ligase family protein [Rhodocyclaceae bacterium]
GVARVALQDPQMALPGLPVFRLDDVTVDDRTASAPGPVAAVLPEALCRIAFSSGTSGDPKGMAMSHRLLALRVQHNSDAQAGNSRLLPMDINFGAGLIPALVTLSVGGAVLFPAGMEIGALCETALVLGATHWDIAPAQGESLAALITTDGPRLPSLLALRVFGGHIAPRLQELLRRRITPQITTAYGTTETGFLSLADAQTLARHPDSVGRIPPWAEVQVVDTGNRPLPPGQQGRLRLRAEGMVSGYWHDPEATARRFQDGWYVPGDLGRVDAEGLLYIAGREDDVLNVGGLKVNPDEVEAALCAHAAVVEAGAFAHVLADGREILAAALVLGSGGTLDAVQAHARTALGPFAPAAYVLARQLPRTPSGKLQRHRLAELISPAGTPAS